MRIVPLKKQRCSLKAIFEAAGTARHGIPGGDRLGGYHAESGLKVIVPRHEKIGRNFTHTINETLEIILSLLMRK
jgi:hypothetical protein